MQVRPSPWSTNSQRRGRRCNQPGSHDRYRQRYPDPTVRMPDLFVATFVGADIPTDPQDSCQPEASKVQFRQWVRRLRRCARPGVPARD